MEMHQLRYIVAVARAGSFSRAAEQCHVSQPSLSQQILKLEEELGERLFDRMKREVRLTAHGEGFLPRALKILDEVDVANRRARGHDCSVAQACSGMRNRFSAGKSTDPRPADGGEGSVH
jgi:DNA-binding transcriptional LysR family regulator